AISYKPSVDFLQHFFHAGIVVLAYQCIIPGECVQASIARARIAPGSLFEPAPQVIYKPWLAARITRRVNSFLVPLDQSLGVGKAAPLFCMTRCRHEEDFGSDVFSSKLAAFD